MDNKIHEGYEFSQLLKLAVQIESIASYDDKLLVGTRLGHLLLYSNTPKFGGEQKHELQMLHYNKNVSKKPIQQLAVIPEHELMIKLSDNVLCLHDLKPHFLLIETMNKTKGATLFSLDVQRQRSLTGVNSVTVRMAVVVKRKVQLYYLKNREFRELAPDISLNDVPRALSWCDQLLCVGYKGSYALVELNGNQQELFLTGKSLEQPLVTRLSENSFTMAKDTESILMKPQEGASEPNIYATVKWTDAPLAIAFDDPYLIAVLSNSIEIKCCDIENQVEIEKLYITARMVSQPRRGTVYVASQDHIWIIQSIPIPKQITNLLKKKQFELALKLAKVSDESDDEKRKNVFQIQTLYAFDLFHNKKFGRAMEEFLKLDTDPREVIRLFPSLMSQPSSSASSAPPLVEDKDQEKGLVALTSYLTEVRPKIFKKAEMEQESKSTQQLMKIIDTTLLKCYLQTNDAMVAPVLRRNHCDLQESERTLKKYGKYSELIILYQTKGLHKEALELLQKQGTQTDSVLRGHEKTVQYLQNLGKDHIDLIFQYAGWVLEANPEDGLKIFTEDIPEVEQLPRPKVLDFLLRTQKHFLVIPYLEHVIHFWKDTNSIFHNALVHEYRERYKQLGGGTRAIQIQQKLFNFLEKSDHYSPETVLIRFPGDDLFEERAVINEKLGRHEHALSIYVSVLGNYQKALKYCDQVYKKTKNGMVYVQLLRLLITPPDSLPGIVCPVLGRSDLDAALDFLEAHADRIPALEALKELPDSVPVKRIEHFLTASLRTQLESRRTTQLLKGLLYAEHLQVQEQRMELESKSILMMEHSVCSVCTKRFGKQSAFVRYPNDKIAHFSCQDKMM